MTDTMTTPTPEQVLEGFQELVYERGSKYGRRYITYQQVSIFFSGIPLTKFIQIIDEMELQEKMNKLAVRFFKKLRAKKN